MAPVLQEMLGMRLDARPLDLVRHLEEAEDALYEQARQGDKDANDALVSLRLAYLRWAYVERRESAQSRPWGRHAGG
jgi:hypothetical protein